jgi:hypothetical protein
MGSAKDFELQSRRAIRFGYHCKLNTSDNRSELMIRPKRTVNMNLYHSPRLLVLLPRMERMFLRMERRDLDIVLSLSLEIDLPSWTRLAR